MAKVTRTYKYRLYPTNQQVARLEWVLAQCRTLYNACLEQRITAYKRRGVTISRKQQSRELTELKRVMPEYNQIGDHVLRDVLHRLDRGYWAAFRRIARGKKAGFPRYKSAIRFHSFRYPDYRGWKLDAENQRLLLRDGEGYSIKIKLHRPLEGEIKTLTIKRDGDQWHAYFTCEVETNELIASTEAVGIDLGIIHFAGLSDGSFIENPHYFRHAQERLIVGQQQLSRCQRGSNRRKATVKRVAAAHRKIARQRADFLHKASHRLINQYGVIAFADRDIQSMAARPAPIEDKQATQERGQPVYAPNGAMVKSRRNRDIYDAGWGYFISMLMYKAEGAGRKLIKVAPEYTSMDCAGCGQRKVLEPDVRVYKCSNCGYSADVDTNTAINVLRLGQAIPSECDRPGNGLRESGRGDGTADPPIHLRAKSPPA